MSGDTTGGCCGQDASGAAVPFNRPGLSMLDWRIGRHSEFLARMLAQLGRQTVVDDEIASATALKPLAALTTRSLDDPTVALLDSWACVLDVLTFYTERFAQEGYLRTATERESVLELARAIGYELDPGVAASAYLAFTVESADDPFREVDVPVGTQVMSVPQTRDELPQVFETVEELSARADWNQLKPQLERPQALALYHDKDDEDSEHGKRLWLVDLDGSLDLDEIEADEDFDPADRLTIDNDNVGKLYPVTPDLDLDAALELRKEDSEEDDSIEPNLQAIAVDHVYLRGTATALGPGDRFLLVGVGTGAESAEGDASDGVHTMPALVLGIEADTDFGLTRVDLTPLGEAARPRRRRRDRLRFRRPRLRTGAVTLEPVPFTSAQVTTEVTQRTWSAATFSVFMDVQAWPKRKFLKLLREPKAAVVTALDEPSPGAWALRQSLGFFGNAAPPWETLADGGDSNSGSPAPYTLSWDATPRSIWTDSQDGAEAQTAFPEYVHCYLEREVEELVPEGWVVLEARQKDADAGENDPPFEVVTNAFRIHGVAHESRTDYALNGKVTGLTFNKPNGDPIGSDEIALPYKVRTTRAHVQSEALELAGLPVRDDIEEGDTELILQQLVLDFEVGQVVALTGERIDAPGVTENEILVLADVQHTGGSTRLVFETGTQYAYKRSTVTVNGNVALGTHGEAAEQALGSGDASVAHQAFTLSHLPLTWVTAPTATGSASTLTVRVNGITWTRVDALYTAGPEDQVYVVRLDDDGTTRVVFGDGVRGARLPTGENNVVATYRKGLGFDGEVGADTLIQLKTRPLGIQGVVNPDAASGAAEPESLDDARVNAPQTVRTLGRVVSLTDFEDFARTFAGIGKAQAADVWNGSRRLVHLTVASASGETLGAGDAVLDNLADALDDLRDPSHAVVIDGYDPLSFDVSARIGVDDRHVTDDVVADVTAALEEAFAFEARAFGQPVSAAEVISVMQAVDGVVFVDLDGLEVLGDGADGSDDGTGDTADSVHTVLRAQVARYDQTEGGVLPAELLLVNPAGIGLETESVHVD